MNLARRSRAWLLFAALPFTAVPGCGSDDGGGGGAVLMTATPGATDTTCPNGGTRLDFGADNNGNGVLDADEVTGSQLVCDRAAPTLTTVTESGASAKCPNGGTTVRSGPDTNGNGVLDDSEVTSTTEICGGGGSVELAKTTSLAPGDVNCPFGGTAIESGLDNGANGGIAGDGVLQPGEILKTSYACIGGGADPSGFVPPPGPPGTGTIRATGGAGTAGAGGNGCAVTIGATQSADMVKVFKTGKFDAAIPPLAETPTFGPRKLDVTSNRSIPSYGSSADAKDGEYYTIFGNGLYFRESATNTQVPVTGVHVAPGVTLSFTTAMTFTLSHDFHNEGVVTTPINIVGQRASLTMTVSKYIGAPGSSVILTGGPVASANGGNGGPFQVTAQRIVNAGTIDTSGANGDPNGPFAGGNAGSIRLDASLSAASGPVINTGTLKAVGGSGKGAGGSGGGVTLQAITRGISHAGVIDTSGGKGGTIPGSAAFVTIRVVPVNVGTIRVSGTISAKGGDVDEAACTGTCSGGSGSSISIRAYAGTILVDADLVATGGKAKGGTGGGGGGVSITSEDGFDSNAVSLRPAGDVRFSGNIDVRGGEGATGGGCSGVTIGITSTQPSSRTVEVRGIATIDTSGGTGTTGGGNAGRVGITLDNPAAGSVVNHAALVARGGDATASGSGGNGGEIVALTAGDPGANGIANAQAVVSAGPIDASGGKGVASGGLSGLLQIVSRERIAVFGPITVAGGNATGGGGSGGATASTAFRAGVAFASNAEISFAGGSGTGAGASGGSCGGLVIRAGHVKSSSPIACKGGNGNGAGGGNGGTTTITSSLAASQLASVSAAGGTGSPNGTPGVVTIDGVVQ